MEDLIGLHTVLLGIKLKVYVVEHADNTPEIDPLRVVLPGDLPHDLGDGFGMLDVKGLLVILCDQGPGFLNTRYVAHRRTSFFLLYHKPFIPSLQQKITDRLQAVSFSLQDGAYFL